MADDDVTETRWRVYRTPLEVGGRTYEPGDVLPRSAVPDGAIGHLRRRRRIVAVDDPSAMGTEVRSDDDGLPRARRTVAFEEMSWQELRRYIRRGWVDLEQVAALEASRDLGPRNSIVTALDERGVGLPDEPDEPPDDATVEVVEEGGDGT